MLFIHAHQLGKQYTEDWVLQGVNCEVKSEDRIGLVGRNGGGKTTLLRLLTGNENADQGSVHIKKGLRIGYMEQIFDAYLSMQVDEMIEMAFEQVNQLEQRMRELERHMSDPTLPESRLAAVLDEYDRVTKQFEQLEGYEKEAKKQSVCAGLGLTSQMLAQRFCELSGGERTKAALVKVLLEQPMLLLLDEPTNHLDVDAMEWLEHFLQDYPGAVLIVSHDRYVLDRTVRQIWDLEDGELTVYPGNYSAFAKEKEKRLLLQFEQYQEQQKKIKKMQDTIKQLREWANQANPPNAGLHRRANSMEKALDRMEKYKRPLLERRAMGLAFETNERSGKDVIMLEQVAKSFGEHDLFANVHLQVRYGERVAIIGRNGSGKSTLLGMIRGEIVPDTGTVTLGSRVQVGYLSQYGIEADAGQMVIEAFRDEVPVDEGTARQWLARFLFYGSAVFASVGSLSGGEKMRLRLAQLMYQPVNLLILDEPTNHLDIESQEVLEEALMQFSGTVLAISHDRYFLNRMFQRIGWLENGQLHGYIGNYEEAKHKRAQNERRLEPMEPTRTPKTREKQQEVPNLLKRQVVLEEKIEDIEEQLMRVEEHLYQSTEQDPIQLQTWMEEKHDMESVRDQLYVELEQLLDREDV